jgi:hypothetical protein
MESKILDFLKVTPDQRGRFSDKTSQFVKLLDGLQMVYYKSPESANKEKLGLTIVQLNNQLMAYLKGEGMGIYNVSPPITARPRVDTAPLPQVSTPPSQQPQPQRPQPPQPARPEPPQTQPEPQPEPPQRDLEQSIRDLERAIKGLDILAKSGNENAKKAVAGLKIIKRRFESQLTVHSPQLPPVEPPVIEPEPPTQTPSVLPISQEVDLFIEKLNKVYGNENLEYSGDRGSSYYKIIYKTFGGKSAWGFVALTDNPKKGERIGDLFKAQSWNAKAKVPRGNILDGTARYDKYSPAYLK